MLYSCIFTLFLAKAVAKQRSLDFSSNWHYQTINNICIMSPSSVQATKSPFSIYMLERLAGCLQSEVSRKMIDEDDYDLWKK